MPGRTAPHSADRTAGPLALVGSGESLPVLEDVERLLLDGRPPRSVQLATAAAAEVDLVSLRST